MFDVAVIGGGASGSLTVTRLLELQPDRRIAWIGAGETWSRGAAYGARDEVHLLNVRASNMSAYPEQPDHFLKWLAQNGHAFGPLDFAPRRVYGDYLASVLEAAKTGNLHSIVGEAIGIHPEDLGFRIDLATGDSLQAKRVVLAIGNLPPKPPRPYPTVADNPRFVNNPWASGTLNQIELNESVLIVGTGLTMADLVLSLTKSPRSGAIFARSRRGLLNTVHRLPGDRPSPPTSVEVWERGCREAGDEWRNVFDSIRPVTPSLWAGLSWERRGRLAARLLGYWDILRHRMPENVAERLSQCQALNIGKGHAVSVEAQGKGFRVEFESEILEVDWIVNATGPASSYRDAKLPLLESLVGQGLAAYDPLGMGLVVDEQGAVGASGLLWALGPVCKGCRLETTAIPEIRVQAQKLAEILAV